MSQMRRTCKFPGCNMGNNKRAYMMPDELEDQDLVTQDMRLHMLIHLTGVSAKIGNKANEHKDIRKKVS